MAVSPTRVACAWREAWTALRCLMRSASAWAAAMAASLVTGPRS